MADNLQLVSLKGQQWEDLQSPLDAFARKHCPTRPTAQRASAASGIRPPRLSDGFSGGSGGDGGRTSLLPDPSRLRLDETDDEGAPSPSWDRSSSHSPLAMLVRGNFPREFPGDAAQKPRQASERRLFDDL